MTASQPECICRDATTTTPTADGVKVKVDWTWNPLCPVHKPAAGDLAPWLTAIWDEDETDTRGLTVAGIEGGWESWIESGQSVGDKTGYVVAYEIRLGAARRHIVRHDPASALARIAADRQILARYLTAVAQDEAEMDDEAGWGASARRESLLEVVKILASAYADRPGYQEAWKP